MPANVVDVETIVQDAQRTAIRDLKRELVGDKTFSDEIIAQF